VLKLRVLFLLLLLPALPAVALDTARPEVRKFIDQMASEHGFEKRDLGRLLKRAETKQPILDAISRPAERVVPWFEYRERFLTDKRIGEGFDFVTANTAPLGRIGDDGIETVVIGILGVETSYGRITGRYRVIDALATLAFDYPPRSTFFKSELAQFLLLSREEHGIDVATALGSYAGAMGAPQFISSSYRQFAVDGNGDGRRDLWSSWDDVVGSIANYLLGQGWRHGEPVVVPATFPDADLARFDTSKLELNETVKSLRDKGVKFDSEAQPDTPAMLIVAQGKDGPEYRVGFNNFYVITRYNRSPMYAMAVNDLGSAIRDRMRGDK
jgi:membrane-bound lytic murein transglycosylase B